MMLILSLLFLAVVIAAVFYYWHKNRASANNRYRKTKQEPRLQPRLNKDDVVDDYDNEDTSEMLGLKSHEKASEPATSEFKVKSTNQSQQPDCVVVLYLMAPENSPFVGYELLQALLSAGMRYGEQRIFHRHLHKDGRGDILFHCASAVTPGTFDLTKMGAFSCKGLCLFFSANSVDEPLSTFDCLLETIDQLVEDLGGQVLDETRAVFTKDRMLKYRQQIRAFETSKTTADLFQ